MPSPSNRVKRGEAVSADEVRRQKPEGRVQKSGQSDYCGLLTRLLTSTRLPPNRNMAPGPGLDQGTEHSMVAGHD
jgi:hypothetical protein